MRHAPTKESCITVLILLIMRGSTFGTGGEEEDEGEGEDLGGGLDSMLKNSLKPGHAQPTAWALAANEAEIKNTSRPTMTATKLGGMSPCTIKMPTYMNLEWSRE